MKLTTHLKLTAIAALPLLPLIGPKRFLAFSLGSILIDFDHYIYYVIRCKRYDIKGMFRYHEALFRNLDRIPYGGICIFHTFDFFAIIGILSFYNSLYYYLLMGLLFHFLLDLIPLHRKNHIFVRSYSMLEHFVRARSHKKNGYPYHTCIGSPKKGDVTIVYNFKDNKTALYGKSCSNG